MSAEPPHVLYKDRPEWADVSPLGVEQTEDSVIKIAYTETFKDCFGYLRAVLRSGEMSERAFELTATCAQENPSCYTVWLLRRKLIQNLKLSISDEIKFMTQQIRENPKNYQVWYHRQKLIEWLKNDTSYDRVQLKEDVLEEIDFIGAMLEDDSKNYHAWQYRQWLLRTFSLWEHELDFCDLMLFNDLRNNSVWNQRYQVIINTTGFSGRIVEHEIKYTLEYIQKAILNESAWNYLRGLILHTNDDQKADLLAFLEAFRDEAREENIFLFSLLLDMYEAADQKDKARETAGVLKKHDKLRENYWDFRQRALAL